MNTNNTVEINTNFNKNSSRNYYKNNGKNNKNMVWKKKVVSSTNEILNYRHMPNNKSESIILNLIKKNGHLTSIHDSYYENSINVLTFENLKI